MHHDEDAVYQCPSCPYNKNGCKESLMNDTINVIKSMADPVLDAMGRITENYRDQGIFEIEGKKYSTEEMMDHLRRYTEIGYKFRTMINELIVTYLLKFKD